MLKEQFVKIDRSPPGQMWQTKGPPGLMFCRGLHLSQPSRDQSRSKSTQLPILKQDMRPAFANLKTVTRETKSSSTSSTLRA